jgi:hypothetical protein
LAVAVATAETAEGQAVLIVFLGAYKLL